MMIRNYFESGGLNMFSDFKSNGFMFLVVLAVIVIVNSRTQDLKGAFLVL